MGKKKERKWQIVPELENRDLDAELIFGLQKAMLLSLLENKQLNLGQYNHAIELLENKKRRQ